MKELAMLVCALVEMGWPMKTEVVDDLVQLAISFIPILLIIAANIFVFVLLKRKFWREVDAEFKNRKET